MLQWDHSFSGGGGGGAGRRSKDQEGKSHHTKGLRQPHLQVWPRTIAGSQSTWTRNSGSLRSEVQAISYDRHSASAAGLELSGHPGAKALPLGSVMLQSYESGLKVRAVILPPPNLRHPATAEYVWESLAKE